MEDQTGGESSSYFSLNQVGFGGANTRFIHEAAKCQIFSGNNELANTRSNRTNDLFPVTQSVLLLS